MTEDAPVYPFSILGVADSATEREIRRAYAKKLKTVRPDEDPAAFQQLVEARDAALRIVRFQASVEVENLDPAQRGESTVAPSNTVFSLDDGHEFGDVPDTQTQGRGLDQAQQKSEGLAKEDASNLLEGALDDIGDPPETECAPSVNPWAIVDKYRDTVLSLDKQNAQTSVEDIHRLLFDLPVGTARISVADEIIQILNDARHKYKRKAVPTHREKALQDIAAVTSDFFGWHENDQPIYASLGDKEGEGFIAFLARAFRRVDPVRKNRFKRTVPLERKIKYLEENANSNLPGVIRRNFMLFLLLGSFVVGIGNAWWNDQGNYEEILREKEFRNHLAAEFVAPEVTFQPSDDVSLLSEKRFVLGGSDVVLDALGDIYKKNGDGDKYVTLLDLVQKDPRFDNLHSTVPGRRAIVLNDLYGWASPKDSCARRGKRPIVDMSPEREQLLKDDVTTKMLLTLARGDYARQMFTAYLLELADGLKSQGRISDLKTFVDKLLKRSRYLPLPEDTVSSLKAAQRCFLQRL